MKISQKIRQGDFFFKSVYFHPGSAPGQPRTEIWKEMHLIGSEIIETQIVNGDDRRQTDDMLKSDTMSCADNQAELNMTVPARKKNYLYSFYILYVEGIQILFFRIDAE